jgi:predicted transposase/invertase (TIGR01784 family)
LGSEENKDVLSGLIHDFYDIEVTPDEITLQNPYNITVYNEIIKGENMTALRQTIKDISAALKLFDFLMEMQIIKTRYINRRLLKYLFDKFSENYNKLGYMELGKEGKPDMYSSLRPVYMLNILGEPHFKDERAFRMFDLSDSFNGEPFLMNGQKPVCFSFFEYKKTNITTENQRHWRDYFLSGEVSPTAPSYIKKASRIIELANLSEEERYMSALLEKAQAEYDSISTGFYHDGLDDGKAIGISERNIAIARNAFRMGLSKEMVMQLTGLTIEEINEIN